MMAVGSNEHNDYLTRKLAHYNQWLLDPKRTAGKPYPGFPDDVAQEKAVEAYKADFVERKAKVAEPKAKVVRIAKAKKTRKEGSGPTKQDRAVEIFQRLFGDKAAVISTIQDELAMSLAGATTYYYNAKKLA
jgi:hypothetical protein